MYFIDVVPPVGACWLFLFHCWCLFLFVCQRWCLFLFIFHYSPLCLPRKLSLPFEAVQWYFCLFLFRCWMIFLLLCLFVIGFGWLLLLVFCFFFFAEKNRILQTKTHTISNPYVIRIANSYDPYGLLIRMGFFFCKS